MIEDAQTIIYRIEFGHSDGEIIGRYRNEVENLVYRLGMIRNESKRVNREFARLQDVEEKASWLLDIMDKPETVEVEDAKEALQEALMDEVADATRDAGC